MRYLIALSICAAGMLRADTITVTVEDGVYPIKGTLDLFDATENLPIPAFDTSLGQLQSATVSWNASLLGQAHYITGKLDGSLVDLDYFQTATFTIGDFSSTETKFDSTQVQDEICHECTVGIPFNLTGQGVITDPNELAQFSGSDPILPVEATIFSTPGGSRDAIIATSGAFLRGEARWTVDVTYQYGVPEPRYLGLLACAFAVVLLKRFFVGKVA